MKPPKVEDGERMTFEQEDYESGRTPYQKKRMLDARKVRSYLIANPGAMDKEIRDAVKVRNFDGVVTYLISRGMIKRTIMGLEVVPL